MSYSYQVYVGNLSTSITTEQLKDLFSQVGQVLNVWINRSNEKITYGFVEFDNIISAEDACKKFNELRLDFSHITVRISERTKNQSKLKIKTNQTTNDNDNDNECQIYVGNLSTSITKEQLKDLFSQVGQILRIWINPEHLKITYGFVKFDNLISAQNACKQFNGLELDSEHIIVRINKDKEKDGTKLKVKTNQTTNDNDNKCYEVYVGNLSTSITAEQLKDLFSQAGQVLDIWINPEHLKITYGFVKFDNLISAQNACKQFNGLELDCEYIIVRITKSKDNTKDYLPRYGILLELPKKQGPSKEFLVKKALAKDLRQNKELGADFVNACIEMEQLTFHDKPEIIKTAPEEVNLDTIVQTIKRYYKPPLKKHNWEVDIDLSKGKLLTEEEYDKFFNLKLSKTLLRKPTPSPKKEKHYSLDYRTVND